MSDHASTTSLAGEDEEPINIREEGHNRDANEEEEERDADARDQEGDGTAEDEERDANAEAHQSEPPHKPWTRKRIVTRWPDDKLTITGLTPTRFPTEKMAHIRIRRLVGQIARQRISLVLPSFNSLIEQDKITIFGERVQPWLEFLE